MSNLRRQTYGQLQCVVFDTTPGAPPERVVVLCHGFGASGEDLVGLAPELARAFPEELAKTRFVFPAAPLDLGRIGMPGGRAWWMIDMLKLQRAAQTGEFRDLRKEVPAELPEIRGLLTEAVEALREETGLAMDRFVLGGFSQGSMAMTDVALHLTEKPAGLIVFSGTLLCETEWRARANGLEGMQVLVSHGTEDPILPHSLAEEIRDLLKAAGAAVEWVSFDDGHTIPIEALRSAAKLIAAVR